MFQVVLAIANATHAEVFLSTFMPVYEDSLLGRSQAALRLGDCFRQVHGD